MLKQVFKIGVFEKNTSDLDLSTHKWKEKILGSLKSSKKMTGSFTTISVNLKHPHELLLLKYKQPLSYHYSKSLETLFFTSGYIFLRKAFGRSVVTEALPSKSAYLFNLQTIPPSY